MIKFSNLMHGYATLLFEIYNDVTILIVDSHLGGGVNTNNI